MFKWVEGSGEGGKFVGGLVSYVDDKIKVNNNENYTSSR